MSKQAALQKTEPLPQGYYVGCRENADAAMDAAGRAFADLLKARCRLSEPNAGNANRLNDFVRDAQKWLASAERFLEYAGRGT